MEYTIPKGLFDILPEETDPEAVWRTSDRWQYVEEKMRRIAHAYGFKEIRTPMFERTELFVRGVGESSDIVSKEMYTFLDKGDRSMTLRPEGTAAVLRAFVENRLSQLPSLHKFFYIGPMFRYERPQAGRYRQHYQFGAEAIGVSKPEQDVEMIDFLCEIYRELGLKNLVVLLNSVGDGSSRELYRQKLTEYLQPRFAELSADSQVRFSKNILRILDSKDVKDQQILEGVPSILETLNEECLNHFEQVKTLLKKQGISYQVNPKLVRGLDYYNKTVFEVISSDLGAQNTIGAGGRYDGLVADLGGPKLPSVGFATGFERILQTMQKQGAFFPPPPHPLVFLIGLGSAAYDYCFELLLKLRHEGVPAEMDLSGKKLQHGLQLANGAHARYALVIGESELASQVASIKDMASRENSTIKLSELVQKLKTYNSRIDS
ncbi:MAG: histidine--tRNA ligase [Chlamydiales bacterium]|nr:histidine--tRNA ligase [Chlamydiales bacterium]